MAVDYNRQYIGARYVPKFFENPNGGWEWEPGFQYEPLTIVKYGENTYTSKKLVPANIGSPNLNVDYWANTGNYNGAIVNLQNELNEANDNINQLFDFNNSFNSPVSFSRLKVLMIGDSYLASQSIQHMGNYFRAAIAGYGGSVDVLTTPGASLPTDYVNMINSTSKYYNMVIVQGFVNNDGNTQQELQGYLNTVNTAIFNKIGKVPVIYLPISRSFKDGRPVQIYNILGALNFLGFSYPAYAPWWIPDSTLTLDSVHPTEAQNRVLGYTLARYIRTLSDSLFYRKISSHGSVTVNDSTAVLNVDFRTFGLTTMNRGDTFSITGQELFPCLVNHSVFQIYLGVITLVNQDNVEYKFWVNFANNSLTITALTNFSSFTPKDGRVPFTTNIIALS